MNKIPGRRKILLTDQLRLLESNDAQASDDAYTAIRQSIHSTSASQSSECLLMLVQQLDLIAEETIACLVTYYVSTTSTKALELIASIREPHEKASD